MLGYESVKGDLSLRRQREQMATVVTKLTSHISLVYNPYHHNSYLLLMCKCLYYNF